MPSSVFSIFRVSCLLLCAALISCSNYTNSRSVHDKRGTPATSGRIKKVPQQQAAPFESGIAWPQGMRRLAVLPIHANRPIDDLQRDMDGIFRGELSKVVKYEIVQVPRSEMLGIINRETVSSSAVIPAQVIQALKEKYAADAVLFTDFTVFRPYRPIAIGVRTKIVDLRNMSVIWMADGILDSGEPDVADLATQYGSDAMQIRYVSSTVPKGRSREIASGNQIILQSPRLYADFVAHEAFASLAPPPPVATTGR
jgi:hypothetical protein